MIRARFKTDAEDYRPVNWPIKHPYWCTGQGMRHYTDGGPGYAVIVAYADDEEEIRRNWPEAYAIESDPATEYQFSSRFQKPDWFTTQDPQA